MQNKSTTSSFLSDNSLKFVDASDVVYTLSVNSGQLEFEGSIIGGGIANVVEDTTSQLGGDTSNSQRSNRQGNIRSRQVC